MVIKQKLPQNCYISFVSVVKNWTTAKINRNHQKNKKNELKISIIFNISQSTMAVKCTFPFSTIKGQRFLLKNDY